MSNDLDTDHDRTDPPLEPASGSDRVVPGGGGALADRPSLPQRNAPASVGGVQTVVRERALTEREPTE